MTKHTEPAIRTVSETDDIHVIEGLGIPFGGPFRGSDTYRSRATPDTNFYWDLFPDVAPDAGTRSDEAVLAEAKFIRPATYNHGFDAEIGLTRVGGWSPVRSSDKGVWVRAQLDKHHAYYGAIRELLDQNALGFSIGSAEHSVRMDAARNWLEWPAYELALTPTPSNPWAAIAARTAETSASFRIVAEPTEPAEATRGIQTFSDIVAAAEMSDELPQAFDTLSSAIYSAIYATNPDTWDPAPAEEKRTAIQASLDQFRDYVLGIMDKAASARSGEAFLSAIRSSHRSADAEKDQKAETAAIPARVAELAKPEPGQTNDDDSPSAEADNDAARSGDKVPTFRIVEPFDPVAVRAAQLAEAERIGAEVAARLLKH